MFCRKGFKETSVQDILDVLHTSKGSFYHHFESKDQVLEQLCRRRAELSAADTAERVVALPEGDPSRLNEVLMGMLPLKNGEAEFMAMLLPILFTAEGRTLAVAYQDALTEAFSPMLERELLAACRSGELCTPGSQPLTPVICAILNRCWLKAAEMMLTALRNGGADTDATDLLEELNMTRSALERLTDAPFGSLRLIDMNEWFETRKRISQLMVPEAR